MSAQQPKDWTPERHEACKAREKAATKGPFHVNRFDNDGGEINWQVQQTMPPSEVIANISDDEPKRARHDAAFFAHAREDVPAMIAKIESLTADVEFYKRRERDICAALGGVGDGGKYRNDIIDAIRCRLRPEGPLHEAVKRSIREAMLNLCKSGVPEEGLAHMLADHAIGLLENQRPGWFTKEPKR